MQGMRHGKPTVGRVLMAGLFDPATGEIAHIHRVVAFDSNRQASQEYVEQRARYLAALFRGDVTKLDALVIDHTKLKRGFGYKVDLKSNSLVEIPRPIRSRRE
jgi:hypothetical protein